MAKCSARAEIWIEKQSKKITKAQIYCPIGKTDDCFDHPCKDTITSTKVGGLEYQIHYCYCDRAPDVPGKAAPAACHLELTVVLKGKDIIDAHAYCAGSCYPAETSECPAKPEAKTTKIDENKPEEIDIFEYTCDCHGKAKQ
jgi:hypothetical protein